MVVSTSPLAYVAIPTEVAQSARDRRRDAFGHELTVSTVIAPCRHCLRIPSQPQEMILLSYQVLPDTGPYAEVGPIFVHAEPCERYADALTFPEDFRSRQLVLRAYDRAGSIADAIVSDPGNAERDALAFLKNRSVAEVHVRHVSYTCFDFKIVRASEP
jgi:hypothetical protein